MKLLTTILSLIVLSIINHELSTAFAQGSLAPAGAPAPTMKALDQIEPRTLISANLTPGNLTNAYIISQPGSYYLSGNIVVTNGNAILITTNAVTLDLNGFSICSIAPSANGSAVTSDYLESGILRQYISVMNGHILSGVTNLNGVYNGSGFANGVLLYGDHLDVEKVSVTGCLDYGIAMSSLLGITSVESCTVDNAGSYGILAQNVRDSTATQCGQCGIYGFVVSQCYGQSISGTGLNAYYSALNCYGNSAGSGDGLDCGNAENCMGQSQSGTGLNCNYSAINCWGYCNSNGGGLYAGAGASNCRGSSYGSGTGLASGGNVNNCIGYSTSGTGLYSPYTVTGCTGRSYSGLGLNATVAIGCYGYSETGTYGLAAYIANSCDHSGSAASISFKYNMP